MSLVHLYFELISFGVAIKPFFPLFILILFLLFYFCPICTHLLHYISTSDDDSDSRQWWKLQMCRQLFCKRIGGLCPRLADTKRGHLTGLDDGFF